MDYENLQRRIEELLIELCDLLQSDSSAVLDWDISNAGTEGFIKNKPSIRSGRGKNSIVEGSAACVNGDDSYAEGYDC